VSPVDELPVGTVTFLFTDIEGSTRLLKQLRERYGEALEDHQRILRETFAAHDGHEIDTQGDSFFVAFRRAKEAVAAAVEGQRRLADHEWPDGTELRVRMGLHTGEPAAAGQRYVGLGVHRAARISAAGHGGQVLVSQATRELLRDDPLPDVSLRDLGEHQLKDLDEPERLYQLSAPGLEETFPPLMTAAATPFEGREDELAEAAVEQMAARWRRPGRRTLIAATFGAAVIGVVAGVLLTQGGGSTASASVQGDSVGVVDPTNGRVSPVVSVGASPGGVAVGDGATWVTNTDADTVSRINKGSNTSYPLQVGGGPVGVAVGDGSVWVANGLDGTVSRINVAANREVRPRINVGNGPVGIAYDAKRKKVWVANSVDGTVSAVDSTTGRFRGSFPAIAGATGIVVAFGRVWVVSPSENAVVSLDSGSGQPDGDKIPVGVDPVAVAAGNGAVWVANRADGTISKIQPAGRVQEAFRVHVGHEPISIAAGKGGVWVGGADGSLVRIDASTGQPDIKPVTLGNPPQALAGADDKLYVAVRSSGAEHRGGTLRVRLWATDTIDPALTYSPQAWTIMAMTNDGLVGFRRVGGIEGVQLVPDLAVSLPTPSPDGRTYTFRLRPGVRYSTGKLVRPADIRRAIERTLEANGARNEGQYFTDIVGAAACRKGHPCNLSRGIVGNDHTVTFRLTRRDGDFLSKLALTGADAVPAGTAPPSTEHDHKLPATGPYFIKKYKKDKSLLLVRNPYFRQWSADAQPDGYPKRIAVSFYPFLADGLPATRLVEHGQADIAPGLQLTKSELATLESSRFSSQLQLTPGPTADFYFLNTHVPPFDDLQVRRAVNYAFDREKYVTQTLGLAYKASCHVLPPDFPGYVRTCPYGPVAVGAAKRLVRRAGRSRANVTVWMPEIGKAQGRFMVSVLNSIGLQARVKLVSLNDYFDSIKDPRNRAQVGYDNWIADYPSAGSFLPPLFSCRRVFNPSQFCDPSIDALFAAAEDAQAQNPGAATALWQKAERRLLAQAPLVPADNGKTVTFLGKGISNFQFHPEWGVLLDQLWLK